MLVTVVCRRLTIDHNDVILDTTPRTVRGAEISKELPCNHIEHCGAFQYPLYPGH
jgi:hypothetical protein